MKNIFDDKEFLDFMKQSIEWRIENQKSLMEAVCKAFMDEELDSEMLKSLHKYQRWRDAFDDYLANKHEVEEGLDEKR